MSGPASEPMAQDASSNRSRMPASRSTSNSHSSDRTRPTYGYHNTFHQHAQSAAEAPPPTYACATSQRTIARLTAKAQAEAAALFDPLPPYTCTVEIEGTLGMKQEFVSPFQVSGSREWNNAYVVLRGTHLSIYRLKHPHFLSKSRTPGPGRLIRAFTLQHAEIGLASDFKKTPLTPKSPIAHLVPASARRRLYETDPHLFEQLREHAIRLRLETEQFLLCCETQEEMLEWIEKLCAAVDISPPLDDRSDPRYRSLPRRSRRQRLLDGRRVADNLENLTNMEAGRRIIAEQELIIRQLYPHLAASNTTSERAEQGQESHEISAPSGDAEADDYDPADARFPGSHHPGSSSPMIRTTSRQDDAHSEHARPSTNASTSSADLKNAPPHRHTPSQALRYRRRCAPILLASSPRVSDVVYSQGQRMRIDLKNRILVEYSSLPPRYDSHTSLKQTNRLPTLIEESTQPRTAERPTSPVRARSDDSLADSLNSLGAEPFGYDLASTSSDEHAAGRLHLGRDSPETTSILPTSEPPSPTAPTQAKAGVARKLTSLGKPRSSEEGPRGNSLNAVSLGIGLLI